MKTLIINVFINLDFSPHYVDVFVIRRSNSGHRHCCTTKLQSRSYACWYMRPWLFTGCRIHFYTIAQKQWKGTCPNSMTGNGKGPVLPEEFKSAWKLPERSELSHNVSPCTQSEWNPQTHTHAYICKHSNTQSQNLNQQCLKLIPSTHFPLSPLSSQEWKEKCPSHTPAAEESRSEAVAVLLVASSMQVPFPVVTMPTCVRRKLSSEPKETWWGPGIISSSLWSPLNRPMSSSSHKRQEDLSSHQRKALTFYIT